MPNKLSTSKEHHEELVKGLSQQMDEILKSSKQPLYLYLDDNHKACNEKLTTLLGYKTPDEWAKIQGSLDPFVAKQSHEIVASAYWKAMDECCLYCPSNDEGGGRKYIRRHFQYCAYQGHLFAVRFITNVAK